VAGILHGGRAQRNEARNRAHGAVGGILGHLPIAKRAATPALAGAFAAGLLALVASPASAEFQVSVYGGWNESFDSDVHVTQPGGTNLEFSDISWDGVSFESPPYYGARITYWFEAHPNWGVSLDYTHAKVQAEESETVAVKGTFEGAPVSGKVKTSSFFDILEFTDGLNLLFVNGVYRFPHERWVPYVGFGVGLSIPHVEYRRFDQSFRTFEYQVAGVAAQALVGAEYKFNGRISAFGEYKISFSQNDADLDRGGSLETDIWTNHFMLGLSYRFGSMPSPAPAYDVSYK
jgi:lipid A oxidase